MPNLLSDISPDVLASMNHQQTRRVKRMPKRLKELGFEIVQISMVWYLKDLHTGVLSFRLKADTQLGAYQEVLDNIQTPQNLTPVG
jgi:hypothetical protein